MVGAGVVVGLVGESRTALLLLLPLLNRRTRSRSFSDGVGELRWDAKSSFLRSVSKRLRILRMTTYYYLYHGEKGTSLDRKTIFFV